MAVALARGEPARNRRRRWCLLAGYEILSPHRSATNGQQTEFPPARACAWRKSLQCKHHGLGLESTAQQLEHCRTRCHFQDPAQQLAHATDHNCGARLQAMQRHLRSCLGGLVLIGLQLGARRVHPQHVQSVHRNHASERVTQAGARAAAPRVLPAPPRPPRGRFRTQQGLCNLCTLLAPLQHAANTQLHPLGGCACHGEAAKERTAAHRSPAAAATPSHSRYAARRGLALVPACASVYMQPMAAATGLPQRWRCWGGVR